MEDVEDPLASRPGAAEPNHAPQEVSLAPPGSTGRDNLSPAAVPNQERDDGKSTAHHGTQGVGAGEEEEEEMEMMDQDELEFLEGNAQLGALRSGK